MLLHERRYARGIAPRIGYIVMRRNSRECVVSCAIGVAIFWLCSRCVDALDRQFNEIETIVEALARYAQNRMEWHVHVRKLFRFLVHEETDQTTEHSLMGDHENVAGVLELGDDGLDATHYVQVTLTPRIAVAKLVLIAPSEFLKITTTTKNIRKVIFLFLYYFCWSASR